MVERYLSSARFLRDLPYGTDPLVVQDEKGVMQELEDEWLAKRST